MRAHEVGLDPHQVAVTRREVNDRLEVQPLQYEPRQRQTTHAHARHRAIGDIDELDALDLEVRRSVENLLRIQSLGWVELRTDDEASGLQRTPQPRTAGGRLFGVRGDVRGRT